MATPVARIGDTSTHGGTITSGGTTVVEGQRVARIGDILNCPIHGPNAIQTGSPRFICQGANVARSGSVTACGATIIGGSTRTFCA